MIDQPAKYDRSKGSEYAGLLDWYVVAVVVVTLLLAAVDRHIITLLVEPIQRDIGLSDTQFGLLHGLAFVGLHAAMTLAVGWLVGRIGGRLTLFSGVALWSVMTAACGTASSFAALLFARAGVGVGEAVVVPAGYSLVGDRFPVEQRGRAIGVLSAAAVVGGGSALLIGGIALAAIGEAPRQVPLFGAMEPWQIIFLLLGICGLPVAGLVMTIPAVRKLSHVSGSDGPGSQPGLWAFLRERRKLFTCLFGITFLNGAMGVGVTSWAPTMLIRKFAIPADEAGIMIGAALIVGGTFGAFAVTARSDTWVGDPRRGGRFRFFPWLIAIAFSGIVILACARSAPLAAAGFGLMQSGATSIFGIAFTATQDLSPKELRPKLLALLQGALAIGSYAIGPLVVALATDYLFADKTKLPEALIVAGCCLGLATVPLALMLKKEIRSSTVAPS